MMPNFFKHLPEDKKQKGIWIVKVTHLYISRDEVVKTKIVKGSIKKAYVLVRLMSFWDNIKTNGRHFGTTWTIENQNGEFVCGYRIIKKE